MKTIKYGLKKARRKLESRENKKKKIKKRLNESKNKVIGIKEKSLNKAKKKAEEIKKGTSDYLIKKAKDANYIIKDTSDYLKKEKRKIGDSLYKNIKEKNDIKKINNEIEKKIKEEKKNLEQYVNDLKKTEEEIDNLKYKIKSAPYQKKKPDINKLQTQINKLEEKKQLIKDYQENSEEKIKYLEGNGDSEGFFSGKIYISSYRGYIEVLKKTDLLSIKKKKLKIFDLLEQNFTNYIKEKELQFLDNKNIDKNQDWNNLTPEEKEEINYSFEYIEKKKENLELKEKEIAKEIKKIEIEINNLNFKNEKNEKIKKLSKYKIIYKTKKVEKLLNLIIDLNFKINDFDYWFKESDYRNKNYRRTILNQNPYIETYEGDLEKFDNEKKIFENDIIRNADKIFKSFDENKMEYFIYKIKNLVINDLNKICDNDIQNCNSDEIKIHNRICYYNTFKNLLEVIKEEYLLDTLHCKYNLLDKINKEINMKNEEDELVYNEFYNEFNNFINNKPNQQNIEINKLQNQYNEIFKKSILDNYEYYMNDIVDCDYITYKFIKNFKNFKKIDYLKNNFHILKCENFKNCLFKYDEDSENDENDENKKLSNYCEKLDEKYFNFYNKDIKSEVDYNIKANYGDGYLCSNNNLDEKSKKIYIENDSDPKSIEYFKKFVNNYDHENFCSLDLYKDLSLEHFLDIKKEIEEIICLSEYPNLDELFDINEEISKHIYKPEPYKYFINNIFEDSIESIYYDKYLKDNLYKKYLEINYENLNEKYDIDYNIDEKYMISKGEVDGKEIFENNIFQIKLGNSYKKYLVNLDIEELVDKLKDFLNNEIANLKKNKKYNEFINRKKIKDQKYLKKLNMLII